MIDSLIYESMNNHFSTKKAYYEYTKIHKSTYRFWFQEDIR